MTSRLMLNLNEPSKITDTSWIEPGRYIGIWWSIHKKQNTWEMGPTHGATTQNVKRYMDFAARHGFSGVLAEGWNPGWGEGEQVSYLKNLSRFRHGRGPSLWSFKGRSLHRSYGDMGQQSSAQAIDGLGLRLVQSVGYPCREDGLCRPTVRWQGTG